MGEKKIEDRKYTHEEYDQLIQELDYKIEYHAGYVRAMAGGKPNHSLISANFQGELYNAFSGGDCSVFDSDLGVNIEEFDLYVYPDVVVTCEEKKYKRGLYLENPSIIVEVASKSTMNYDKGKKQFYYFSLPSLKEYVIVSTVEPLITVHSKNGKGNWETVVSMGLKSKIYLANFELEISLGDVYRQIFEFEGLND